MTDLRQGEVLFHVEISADPAHVSKLPDTVKQAASSIENYLLYERVDLKGLRIALVVVREES